MPSNFTERFIRLPIDVYEVDTKEKYNMDVIIPTYTKLNPFDITSYRPTADGKETAVYCRNGENFVVSLHINEFEKRLNEHQK